jgi:hypothetical protein
MSTLTQSSLDDAITKLRDQNARTIKNLCTKIQNDVQSMETQIAAAVIQAVKNTQNEQMKLNHNHQRIPTQRRGQYWIILTH